jgi:hypothetical protein
MLSQETRVCFPTGKRKRVMRHPPRRLETVTDPGHAPWAVPNRPTGEFRWPVAKCLHPADVLRVDARGGRPPSSTRFVTLTPEGARLVAVSNSARRPSSSRPVRLRATTNNRNVGLGSLYRTERISRENFEERLTRGASPLVANLGTQQLAADAESIPLESAFSRELRSLSALSGRSRASRSGRNPRLHFRAPVSSALLSPSLGSAPPRARSTRRIPSFVGPNRVAQMAAVVSVFGGSADAPLLQPKINFGTKWQ